MLVIEDFVSSTRIHVTPLANIRKHVTGVWLFSHSHHSPEITTCETTTQKVVEDSEILLKHFFSFAVILYSDVMGKYFCCLLKYRII